MPKELKELTKRAENYSQWFNDLVIKADLAEQSAVRGCMVIKPYGYAIWEKMQQQLDKMFKEIAIKSNRLYVAKTIDDEVVFHTYKKSVDYETFVNEVKKSV